MVLTSSIGCLVSFSISASPMQLASVDIIALLTEQQVCWVKSDAAGLCLQFLQPSSLLANAKSTNFTPPRLNGSSIRLFGKPVDWLLLNALSQLLSDVGWLKLLLLAPHPQLSIALLIQLSDVLSTEQQRQLDEFAAEHHIEVVYLAAKSVRLNKPGLLVMDMDSTALSIECIDEIAMLAGVRRLRRLLPEQ
jgi:phosphoserine phosphatase